MSQMVPQKQPRRRLAVLVLLMVMVFATVAPSVTNAAPATSNSFSINVTELLTQAENMFNSVFPILAVLVGITFGLGLASWVSKKFSGLVGGGK
jgi:hypothetical protein